MIRSPVWTILWGSSALLLLLFVLDPKGVAGGSVDGMKCANGTVLTGKTGPERILEPSLFCKMFPKHPWQYPPLGYGDPPSPTSYPYDCDRIMGGYLYWTAGNCPRRTPEQVSNDCMKSDVPKEIIRDIACAILKDPGFLGRFMNNKNRTRNLIEFAAFMAHVGQETGDLQTIWESNGNAGPMCDYYYGDDNKYCKDNYFYGRGVHQLTHPSNYSDFSEYWYKDRLVLLKDPGMILKDMEVSWGSAIWFWMAPRFHHNGDATCGKESVQHEALFEGLGFGETTSTINGGVPMPWVTGGAVKLPPFITKGCSSNNEMELVVKRVDWKELEDDTYSCQGWNQPYPCGWGDMTQGGPDAVKSVLAAFKKGAKGAIKAPACPVPWDDKPDRNTWPYNIAQDEGYYSFDDTGGTTPEVPELPEVPEPPEEPELPEEPETPNPPDGGGDTGSAGCTAKIDCVDRCINVVEAVFEDLP